MFQMSCWPNNPIQQFLPNSPLGQLDYDFESKSYFFTVYALLILSKLNRFYHVNSRNHLNWYLCKFFYVLIV